MGGRVIGKTKTTCVGMCLYSLYTVLLNKDCVLLNNSANTKRGRDWRDSSASQSNGLAGSGGFDSQHSCGQLTTAVTTAPGDPTPSSDL